MAQIVAEATAPAPFEEAVPRYHRRGLVTEKVVKQTFPRAARVLVYFNEFYDLVPSAKHNSPWESQRRNDETKANKMTSFIDAPDMLLSVLAHA